MLRWKNNSGGVGGGGEGLEKGRKKGARQSFVVHHVLVVLYFFGSLKFCFGVKTAIFFVCGSRMTRGVKWLDV